MNRQEIENKISEIENNFKSEIDKLKQELNKDEEWKPKDREDYWYYDKDLERICEVPWVDDEYDNARLKNRVIFKTEAEAQRYADYQKAKEEYSYEFSKEEWEDDNKDKVYIYYCHSNKTININVCFSVQYIGDLCFKTKDQAQEFIDKYKNEILEFEFGIEEEK